MDVLICAQKSFPIIDTNLITYIFTDLLKPGKYWKKQEKPVNLNIIQIQIQYIQSFSIFFSGI